MKKENKKLKKDYEKIAAENTTQRKWLCRYVNKVEENEIKLIHNNMKCNMLIKELKTKVWNLIHKKLKKKPGQKLISIQKVE